MKRAIHLVGSLSCALVLNRGVSAQEAQGSEATAEVGDTTELEGLLDESVVSTASRVAESAHSAPSTSWSITAEELLRYGISTIDEAINFLSMGMVSERQLDYPQVGARGVLLDEDYGSHVLVLLDGHVVNEPWDGAVNFGRNAALPFEIVDHIEVVLGPGSVLYGSNAMLGVINIVTKSAKDFPGWRLIVESELPSSLRVGAGLGQQFELLDLPGEVTAELEYYASEGPSLRIEPQLYGYDSVTGRPKRFNASGPGTGIWGGTIHDGRFARVPAGYLRLKWGDLAVALRAAQAATGSPLSIWTSFDDPDTLELDRWLSGDIRYGKTIGIVDIAARLYGDSYEYRERLPTRAAEDCLPGQNDGCIYRLGGLAKWTGLDLLASFDWLSNARFVTRLGADGRLKLFSSSERYQDRLTQQATVINAYEELERNLGVYLEQTAQIASFLGANAGLRLDFDQGFGYHLSPRAAVTFSVWSGGVLKAIYSEAFRAPNGFERFYTDPSYQVRAVDLRPESVRSGELVVEQRLGVHRILVGGFYSHWRDLISTVDLSEEEIAAAILAEDLVPDTESALQYRNLSSIRSYGANVGYQASALRRRLRFALTVTAAHVEIAATEGNGDEAIDEHLPGAAQVFGNARVSYDLGGRLPVLALAGRFLGPRPVSYSDFEPYPTAPPQVELRLTASGAAPFVPGLSYRLSGNVAFCDRSAFSMGPLTEPAPGYDEQALTPVDCLRVLLLLQYELPAHP